MLVDFGGVQICVGDVVVVVDSDSEVDAYTWEVVVRWIYRSTSCWSWRGDGGGGDGGYSDVATAFGYNCDGDVLGGVGGGRRVVDEKQF